MHMNTLRKEATKIIIVVTSRKEILLYFSLLLKYATLVCVIFYSQKRLNVFTYWTNENELYAS